MAVPYSMIYLEAFERQVAGSSARVLRIPSESAFSPREREWHFLSLVADEILEGIDDDEDDDKEGGR